MTILLNPRPGLLLDIATLLPFADHQEHNFGTGFKLFRRIEHGLEIMRAAKVSGIANNELVPEPQACRRGLSCGSTGRISFCRPSDGPQPDCRQIFLVLTRSGPFCQSGRSSRPIVASTSFARRGSIVPAGSCPDQSQLDRCFRKQIHDPVHKMGTPQADRQNGRNREKRRIGTHDTNIIFPGMGGEPVAAAR